MMIKTVGNDKPIPYQSRVYELVREVPKGFVASYGMIAAFLPNVSPRMVGYAMAATPQGQNIPWQRIINSAGKISDRPGSARQRAKLEAEGVSFNKAGTVSWTKHRWQGPSDDWMQKTGFDPLEMK